MHLLCLKHFPKSNRCPSVISAAKSSLEKDRSIGLSLIQDVQIPGFTIYLPQSKKTKSSLPSTLNGSQGLPKFACCSMFLLGGLALWLIPLQTPIAKSTRRVKTYHPSCVYLCYPFPSKETVIFPSVHESESDFVKMNKFFEFLSPSHFGCSWQLRPSPVFFVCKSVSARCKS